MLTEYEQTYLTKLVDENEAILKRFEDQGVPMGSPVTINFFSEFRSFEDAQACLQEIRQHLKETPLTQADSTTTVFAYIRDNESEHVELTANSEMILDVGTISELELAFLKCAANHDGGDVSWEFEDPRDGIKNSSKEDA